MTELDVRKTYKLFIDGKFPRSESGRVYEVTDSAGDWLANAPLASRKDARDAVVAARKAFGGWSGKTAYNRGQVLYRIAEVMEGRHEQFSSEVAASEGLSISKARARPPDVAAQQQEVRNLTDGRDGVAVLRQAHRPADDGALGCSSERGRVLDLGLLQAGRVLDIRPRERLEVATQLV